MSGQQQWEKYLPILSGILAVLVGVAVLSVVFVNIQSTTAIASLFVKPTAPTNSNASPTNTPVSPRLSLIAITSSACLDCSNLSAAFAAVKASGAQITSQTQLDLGDPSAKALIAKYGAAKVPTLLVQGETRSPDLARAWGSFGVIREDGTVLYTGQQPPYVNVSTGSIVGRLNLTVIVDPSCKDCPDYATAVKQFRDAGLTISRDDRVIYNSTEGMRLIALYNLTKIPSVLLSRDAAEYAIVQQAWDQIGSREKDGTLVLRQVNPPYLNLSSKRIEGLVSLVNVVNDSCTECYNVSIHKQLFARLGMVFANESTFDVSSSRGRALLAQYNLTKLPTVLLSPEAGVYPVIGQIWNQLGTKENDSWFVFRNMEALPNLAYYDLTLGKVVGANGTNAGS